MSGVLPLRLANLLSDRSFDGVLDDFDNRIHFSFMKQSHDEGAVQVAQQNGPGQEATLFSFLDVADRLYTRVAEALRAVGLSYAKYDVLEQLRRAGEPVSLRVLAEGQNCAASNITQIVDRLEADGLVQRTDDPEDRRSVRAQLTPEGEVLALEGATQIDVVRAQFAASFSAAERVQLATLLVKIR